MVFDAFRRSFDELLDRATRPEERRVVASRMKDTLVQAKVGLTELQEALAKARTRLAAEETELATVRRRKQLAEGIQDRETVDIAAKYEAMHVERVQVLRQRVSAQEAEVALAEREVSAMSSELKTVLAGLEAASATAGSAVGAGGAGNADLDQHGESETASLHDEIDALGRSRARADREADAARRLEELKRRMGGGK